MDDDKERSLIVNGVPIFLLLFIGLVAVCWCTCRYYLEPHCECCQADEDYQPGRGPATEMV